MSLATTGQFFESFIVSRWAGTEIRRECAMLLCTFKQAAADPRLVEHVKMFDHKKLHRDVIGQMPVS